MFARKAGLLATAFVLLSAAQLFAQTRDETLKLISDSLAKANEPFQQAPVSYGTPYPAGYMSGALKTALKTVADLKDQLSNNPYFRVTAVTISLPWGVSVELTPVEASDAKQ